MPRNGSGQFVLPPATNPVIPDTIIATSWANPTLTDIAAGLSTSIATDGQTTPTANLPMGGYRHTNVGNALAANQYAAAGQVQGFVFNIVTNVQNDSGAVTFTGTTPFGIGAGTVGIPNLMPLLFVPSANNGGPSTLTLNQGTPHPILNSDATPLFAGQITAGRPYALVYSGTNWILITNTLDLSILNSQFLRLAGGTMQGALTLAQAPSTDLMAATKKYVDDAVSGSVAGVATFNTRVGNVVLLSSDVTGALSYTPFNAAGGTITGAVTIAAGALNGPYIRSPVFAQTCNQNHSASGTINMDPGVARSFLFVVAGALTLTITGANLARGEILRIQLWNTNVAAITLPAGIVWPMPIQTAPDLASGTLKRAVIVLQKGADDSSYLGNVSIY